MFPKKIYQTWKNKTVHDNLLMKEWHVTWSKHNPEYECVLWDDNDNRNFIATYYDWFLPIYDAFNVNIKRVDAVRYFYLLKYGGIYADMDFECLKSFDPLLEAASSADVILGQLGEMDNPIYNPHKIPNALMISKPEADFISFVIKAMVKASEEPNTQPEAATGPVLLTLCYDAYVNGIIHSDLILNVYKRNIFEGLAPSDTPSAIALTHADVFYPINWANKQSLTKRVKMTNEEAAKNFPDSLAITYWLHSWP